MASHDNGLICVPRLLRLHNLKVNTASKVLTFERLKKWREDLRSSHRTLVVTNGCFDLLHAGHVSYLQAARALGDALLVGINSDASVRTLKGAGRPLNTEQDRAFVLSGLQCVDAVYIFPELKALAMLEAIRPDVYVKGGDYNIDTMEQTERRLVESQGGKVAILPLVPGRSTTAIIERMNRPA
jgi:rfaE bifunctional protein nucleotidyltransferase chain/domain